MAAAKSKKAKKTAVKTAKKATVKKKTVAKKKPAAKKTAVKKTAVKKTAAKKTAVKKATKKVTAKRKTTAKKTTAKKVVAAGSVLNLKSTPVSAKQTQAQVILDLAEATNLDKKSVKHVLEALRNQIHRHLKNNGSGEMTLPGLGIKVRRVTKKATKARKGVNPFTGEPMTIKAKPARKAARATALKALKDLV